MQTVIGEEAAVQRLAGFLQDADSDVNAGITQPADSPTLHFGELVDAADDDAPHALTHNQVGTRGRLAVVGTGF